jgi:transcriptional regulator with XRE-family HTH domain
MGSLHSCHKQLIAKKPLNMAYPTSLSTLGDHLRKVRLDRGLSQPQVAKLLKVTQDTVTGWELNRHEAQTKMVRRIIKFLGYIPFSDSSISLGHQLHQARLILGHTQEQSARIMKCDCSNLRCIELDKRKPRNKILSAIEKYVLLSKVSRTK